VLTATAAAIPTVQLVVGDIILPPVDFATPRIKLLSSPAPKPPVFLGQCGQRCRMLNRTSRA
jgi:hypothetical protein